MDNEKQNHQSEVIEETDNFRRQVREEIGSLREKIDSIWEILESEYSFDGRRMLEKVRRFPLHLKEPIRWGFIGGWRRGGHRSAGCSIHTTEMDEFFNDPNASPEHVAEFAEIFTNPKTVEVCRHAFAEKQTRAELKLACKLTDEALDEAVQPLVNWKIAEWKEQDGVEKLCGKGHGFQLAVTMISLTKTWHRENVKGE